MAVDFGRYQLLKKIASGGMGQVFLARAGGSGGFEKLLVIKRILPQLVEDDEFIEMFFDEARIAARLNHPNLVQIFDLAEADGSHYLAMEYVAGEDLRRVDKKTRAVKVPFPVGLILRITADAAAGLDYAHKARDAQGKPLNLVHRDVSPQNILVGFDGAVKLIDFGVAKAANKLSNTATGTVKGKYAYMSPEQARGEDLDGRSDLFGLATVFWETLTGQRLWKRENEVATMKSVVKEKHPAPSATNPDVPPELDAIVGKALAKKRTDRFASCGEFQLALEDFVVEHRLPATNKHLAALMQELFEEEIDALNIESTGVHQAPPKLTPSLGKGTGSRPKAPAEETLPKEPSKSVGSKSQPKKR